MQLKYSVSVTTNACYGYVVCLPLPPSSYQQVQSHARSSFWTSSTLKFIYHKGFFFSQNDFVHKRKESSYFALGVKSM